MPVPAHAASKEIIELQTQVQQLLDDMQRLQSTMDSRFGVLQHLVEQSADTVNQMTAAVNDLQKEDSTRRTRTATASWTPSPARCKRLNDSVDELKSRIAKLDKSIQDMQTQLQTPQPTPAGVLVTAQVLLPQRGTGYPSAGGRFIRRCGFALGQHNDHRAGTPA